MNTLFKFALGLAFISLGWWGYEHFHKPPFDGRPVIVMSEDIANIRVGEPVRYDTYVFVSDGDIRKTTYMPEHNDKRVQRHEDKKYMRADLYLHYRKQMYETW